MAPGSQCSVRGARVSPSPGSNCPPHQAHASAAENELRRRVGRRLIADWQAEHGAFTVEELAAARAEMAAADAEALGGLGQAAA